MAFSVSLGVGVGARGHALPVSLGGGCRAKFCFTGFFWALCRVSV